jgi:thiosulfate/3-mercaptopyruvate sulfurtransferase
MRRSSFLLIPIWSFVGLIFFSTSLFAEGKLLSKRSEFLVAPEVLIKSNSTATFRVIDTRDHDAYQKGHIPGAVWVDSATWKKLSANPKTLVDAKSWEEPLAKLGIQQDMRVIVYGDPMSDVARMWWLLKYLGVKNVAILDGGYKAWTAAEGKTTSDVVEVPAGVSTVHLDDQRLIELSELVECCLEEKNATLIDNRSAAEFNGEAGASQRKGRIPGACHVEWLEFLDTNGRFLSDEQLREKLASPQLDPAKQIILHCQTGGRSSVGAFVVEMLGYPKVGNYYNGWSQYSVEANLPVSKN